MSVLLRVAAPAALTLALLTGCASDGSSPFAGAGGATTASVAPPATSTNPACVALNSRIDALRREGVTERAAQAAATGKTTTVSVKRASLANLAELDKANAEFQSKCSTLGPRAMTATAAPAPVPAASAVSSAPAKATATAKVAKAAPQAQSAVVVAPPGVAN